MTKKSSWLSRASIALILVLASAAASGAAELKVMSSGAYRAALDDVIPLFEKASGHKVVVQYDPAAVVGKKIGAGEAFDVAITSAGALDGLIKQGIVASDAHAIVGVNAASIAYRRGSAKPDISTLEALKAALLAARTVSFSDPAGGGSSSNFFAGVLDRLGIAEDVRRKAILTKPGEGAVPVADGRAELGVAQTSEIVRVEGVEGVPLLPSDPKRRSSYAAGVSGKSAEPDAARGFIAFMTSPAALAIRKAKGLGD